VEPPGEGARGSNAARAEARAGPEARAAVEGGAHDHHVDVARVVVQGEAQEGAHPREARHHAGGDRAEVFRHCPERSFTGPRWKSPSSRAPRALRRITVPFAPDPSSRSRERARTERPSRTAC